MRDPFYLPMIGRDLIEASRAPETIWDRPRETLRPVPVPSWVDDRRGPATVLKR